MKQKKKLLFPSNEPIRVLAVASGGGHWNELLRLCPALDGCELYFIGIDAIWESTVTPHPFYVVPDAHFEEPWRMIRTFFRMLRLFRKILPQIVISTGAAPGGMSMLLGRIFHARTLWVDSNANCKVLSFSGKLALRIAHKTITQHLHLARPGGPIYQGKIII